MQNCKNVNHLVNKSEFEGVLVGSAAAAADCCELEARRGQHFHERGHDFTPVCEHGVRLEITAEEVVEGEKQGK